MTNPKPAHSECVESLRAEREKNHGAANPRCRVLVVDDFPDAAEAVSALLTFLGHECKIARGGVEALAVADQHPFDVAIIDIGMPDLSGYEVARALRARPNGPGFLAALTAWGSDTDRANAFAAGFDHHVVKPATVEKLTTIIALAVAR